MARKRKDPRKPPPAPEPADPVTQVPPTVEEPDVFDAAIAARATADQCGNGFVAQERVRRRQDEASEIAPRSKADPNPFPFHAIALTAEGHTGPQIHLFRERANRALGLFEHAVAIRFDEKPGDEVRVKLRDNGFEWKAKDGVWKKPLGDYPVSEEYNAHKLFVELANAIRVENGLQPVQGIAATR